MDIGTGSGILQFHNALMYNRTNRVTRLLDRSVSQFPSGHIFLREVYGSNIASSTL